MRCVKSKRADMLATVCAWCDGSAAAREATAELEASGYSVTRGVCAPCLNRYNADSLKGTVLQLAEMR